jgi:hypothetical protein
MEPYVRTSTVSIDADAAAVWAVLADEFVESFSAWSPGVKSSGPNPATPQGINGSRHGGRVADVEGFGNIDVRLTAYDAHSRTLSYTVEAEKIPSFIEKLQNTWAVTSNGSDGCIVETQVDIMVAESMSGNEQASKAVDNMLIAGTGASTNLKMYIESDEYRAR